METRRRTSLGRRCKLDPRGAFTDGRKKRWRRRRTSLGKRCKDLGGGATGLACWGPAHLKRVHFLKRNITSIEEKYCIASPSEEGSLR